MDGYGIAVIAAGSATSPALQHLVIEGNTVTGTRTGQSETVTINGDVTGFLAAGNVIHDTDNIGLDTIGWETGTSQASHGYVTGNTVYNVDTWSNAAYGKWSSGTAWPGRRTRQASTTTAPPTSGSTTTPCGTPTRASTWTWRPSGKETDHLLVSGNTVYDDPGTSKSDPSTGTNPPGTAAPRRWPVTTRSRCTSTRSA